jgi:DNA-binding FrmR family transcriptional regulator
MLDGHLHHCVLDAIQDGRSEDVFSELVELYRIANK